MATDQDWLRARLEELERIERPSASEGERDEPLEGIRVILLSAGAEESFSEGMKAFGERHFPRLPRESAVLLCLESTGLPHLLVLRGFLKMREYSPRAVALMASSNWRPATRPPSSVAAPILSSRPTTTGGTTSSRTSTSARSRTPSASPRRRSAASASAGSSPRNSDCGVGFRLYSIRARALP